jgi:hypothetical protein
LNLLLPVAAQPYASKGCTKLEAAVYVWNTLDYTPWIQ